jgi:hypothetical protein
MQSIETTDRIEARRARIAQYRGGIVRFSMMGMTINGIVQSVMEVKPSKPKRWIVTVIAKQKAAARASQAGTSCQIDFSHSQREFPFGVSLPFDPTGCP